MYKIIILLNKGEVNKYPMPLVEKSNMLRVGKLEIAKGCVKETPFSSVPVVPNSLLLL